MPSAWRREDCKAERGPTLLPDRTETASHFIRQLRRHNIGRQAFFWELAIVAKKHRLGLAELEKALSIEGLTRPKGFPGRWNTGDRTVDAVNPVKSNGLKVRKVPRSSRAFTQMLSASLLTKAERILATRNPDLHMQDGL